MFCLLICYNLTAENFLCTAYDNYCRGGKRMQGLKIQAMEAFIMSLVA